MKTFKILFIISLVTLASCGGGDAGGGAGVGVSTTSDGIAQSSSKAQIQYFDSSFDKSNASSRSVLANDGLYRMDIGSGSGYDHTQWDLVKYNFNGQEVFRKPFPTDVASDEFEQSRFTYFGGDINGNTLAIVQYYTPVTNGCCSFNDFWMVLFDSNGDEINRLRFDDPLRHNDTYIIFSITGKNNKFYILTTQEVLVVDLDLNLLGRTNFSDEDTVGRGMYSLGSWAADPQTLYVRDDGSFIVEVKTHNHYGDYGAYYRHYEIDGTFNFEKWTHYVCGGSCDRDSWVPYHSGHFRSYGLFTDKDDNDYWAYWDITNTRNNFVLKKFADGSSNSSLIENFVPTTSFSIVGMHVLPDGDFLIVGNASGHLGIIRYDKSTSERKWAKVFDGGTRIYARKMRMTSSGNLRILVEVTDVTDTDFGSNGSSEVGLITISKAFLDAHKDVGNVDAAKIDSSVIATPPLADFGTGSSSEDYDFSCTSGEEYRQTIHYTAQVCLEAKKFYTKTMNCLDSSNFSAAFTLCESACGSVICEEE
ncbi:MAG: hypothetical protein KC493_06205 [Bacteriovoracaceae bacterium]|nr:hypothetical protein [Bacteriovoracaceae bacterium]